MAGKGPSGATLPDLAMPTVLPTSTEKCPKSPGKRKYYNLVEAETAAAFSAQQYGKPMRAYVCDGCGLYHVTGKIHYGDVTESRADGTIVSAGMSTRPAWKSQTLAPSVERVDMSEVIASESPIVPGNAAAREKLVAEYLEGRETVTVPEIMEYTQTSRYQASQTLRMLGWAGTRGTPEWYPPGKERPTPKRSGSKPGKSVRGNSSTAQKRKALLKKLNTYLADKDAVTTAEIQVHLPAGKDMAKALLREAGWNAGWGANAKWTPGEDKLAHRRRIVPTQAQIEKSQETEVAVNDPIDMATRRPAEVAPAEAALPEPAGVTESGWRNVPDPEGVRTKTIEQMMAELAPYGLEVRIQIRERR